MDARTGAIVASSTYPTFNPNDLNTLTNYLNPLVSYAYEPGSTMKYFLGLQQWKKVFITDKILINQVQLK